jgi:hypothetical protein
MVFNTTFSNISVISWRSFLLVEEAIENPDMPPVTDNFLSHNVVSSTIRRERDSNLQLQWWQALTT